MAAHNWPKKQLYTTRCRLHRYRTVRLGGGSRPVLQFPQPNIIVELHHVARVMNVMRRGRGILRAPISRRLRPLCFVPAYATMSF